MLQSAQLRLRNEILQQVRDGVLQPGDRLPSANQLKRHYGIPRMRVLRVMQELADEGVLRRMQELGTFVTNIPHQGFLVKVYDIVDEITRLGGEPHVVEDVHRRMAPPEDVRALLGIDRGEEITCVSQLHSMDGKPVAYEECFAHVNAYPKFADPKDDCGVFEYLKGWFDLDEIKGTVSTVHADEHQAECLQLDPLEPCIRVQRRYKQYYRQSDMLSRVTFVGTRHDLAAAITPSETRVLEATA